VHLRVLDAPSVQVRLSRATKRKLMFPADYRKFQRRVTRCLDSASFAKGISNVVKINARAADGRDGPNNHAVRASCTGEASFEFGVLAS
jgi:hypothetical protein